MSRIAHVDAYPAETETAVLPSPRSTAGRPSPIRALHSLVLRSVFSVGWHETPFESRSAPVPMFSLCPWPRLPHVFRPQHFRTLLSRIAQVCVAPASIAIAVLPEPRSAAARSSPISFDPSPMAVEFPMPSWP